MLSAMKLQTLFHAMHYCKEVTTSEQNPEVWVAFSEALRGPAAGTPPGTPCEAPATAQT